MKGNKFTRIERQIKNTNNFDIDKIYADLTLAEYFESNGYFEIFSHHMLDLFIDITKHVCKSKLTKKPLCFELSKDRRGAEYGGAIKNVVAIGCGILDGIGEGANTKAALLTEAMQEMSIIMLSQGCTQYSVYGLCGLGDAILTGMSAISRNRRLGEKLGQGLDLEEAKKQVGTIAEGLNSVQSVHDIINKNNLNCPVINAIWEIVVQGKKANALLSALGFKDE